MEMSIEVQIKNIVDLQAQIELISANIKQTQHKLNAHLEYALSKGLPIEYYNKYKASFLNPLNKELEELSKKIVDKDKNYLIDVENLLRKSLE